jgi:2-oxoglutarate ferredoxin oxidoreductase subunit gamma
MSPGIKKMLIKTVFSGFGGQGVIMMGYLLAIAGMYEEKNVTCLPSYGAEVRGGTANCTVVISTEEIASPVASDSPSLFRFQNQVQSGGTIFLNSSMIESRPVRGDLEIFEVPVNDLAKECLGRKVANMIMLGAFVKKSGLASLDTMLHVVKDTFGDRNPGIFKSNKTALQLGFDYLK